VQRVGGGDVVLGLGVGDDGEVGEAGLLATMSSSRPVTEAKLAVGAAGAAAGFGEETLRRATKASNMAWTALARSPLSRSVADIISSIMAPERPSPAERGDVAAVDADVQREDVGVPLAGHHERGGEGGFARGGAGQREQQLADGHGSGLPSFVLADRHGCHANSGQAHIVPMAPRDQAQGEHGIVGGAGLDGAPGAGAGVVAGGVAEDGDVGVGGVAGSGGDAGFELASGR
jgi:hypothetical protein